MTLQARKRASANLATRALTSDRQPPGPGEINVVVEAARSVAFCYSCPS